MQARPIPTGQASSSPLFDDDDSRRGGLRHTLLLGDPQGIVEPQELAIVNAKTVVWSSFSSLTLDYPRIGLIVPIVRAFDAVSIAFFEHLSKRSAPAPVLAVLPGDQGRSEHFALATKAVDDFLLMPVRREEWRQRVLRLTGPHTSEAAALRDRLIGEIGLAQLVGRAPAFLEVLEKIPLVARSGSPALITGETGTGKELCARAIHLLGPRRSQPFIPVDCGAIPDNLFENEIFGHVRGAFTDAHRDQRGLVGLAEGGTLFLDEVDSLSIPGQTKLLRFLQERSFRPLGSERFVHADVNVLAAMNREPESLVRDKVFRSDLFYRLNVIRLHLAPLRERRSDIPLLARHFVTSYCAETGLAPRRLSPAVLPRLLSYHWPGNVRELDNVLQRAVVLATGCQILPEHVSLPDRELASLGAAGGSSDGETMSFRQGRSMVVEAFEKSYVSRLIEKHGGNVTRAAREAQKDRRAFGRLLKKHGIRGGSSPT